MNAITIRLVGAEAESIGGLVEENPALNPHLAGRLAMRLGLRVIEQDPAWVRRELREMRAEAQARRRARRARRTATASERLVASSPQVEESSHGE